MEGRQDGVYPVTLALARLEMGGGGFRVRVPLAALWWGLPSSDLGLLAGRSPRSTHVGGAGRGTRVEGPSGCGGGTWMGAKGVEEGMWVGDWWVGGGH